MRYLLGFMFFFNATSWAMDDAPVSAAAPAFDIDGSIALGLKGKEAGLYLSELKFTPETGFRATIYTPATWVQFRAQQATQKYVKYTRDDVTAEDLRDVLRVTVSPNMPTKINGPGSNVKHLVLRDIKKVETVQPSSIEFFDESASNAFGAAVTYKGATAVFPMAEVARLRALDPKGEFRLVVVGDTKADESDFQVKTKHFKHLGWPETK